MKKVLLASLLLVCSITSWAQYLLEVDKSEFKKDENYKEAWFYVKEGIFMLEEGTIEGATEAIKAFLKATSYNNACNTLNYNLARAYSKTRQHKKALTYWSKVFQANPSISPTIRFELARAQHMNSMYEQALQNYKSFKAQAPDNFEEENNVSIDKRIRECQSGIELNAKKARVLVENLGQNINTQYAEHSPLITADNSVMYFTSRRPLNSDAKRDADGKYFENIFVSECVNGVWQKAKPVGAPLNTNHHDATIGLSPDGQKMLIFKSKGKGDIYISQLEGEEWEQAQRIKGKVNSSERETSACLSYDGKALYFVSNKKHDGAQGQCDIYVSTIDAKGRWGQPKNLGESINTPYNEEHVSIMPDGKTLYFSSQGHNTIGGLDIFVSEQQEDGTWSKAENLGPPINTPGDDVFYVAAANGKYAYYSSAAAGGLGGSDIYKVTFMSPENPLVMDGEDNLIASLSESTQDKVEIKPIKLKTIRLTLLKGRITDATSQAPLHAEIEIVDNEKNQVIFTSKANSATGRYLVSLPSGKNYGIAVSKEGYLFHSENFEIPPAQDYTEIEKNIQLLNLAVGSTVILKNIFFDTGKASLRTASVPEIERIQKFLLKYPKTSIKIVGHTDNVGTAADNLALSKSRAKAVVDALAQTGIAADRLQWDGHGEKSPIATNSTPQGRQENRRVEFELLTQ